MIDKESKIMREVQNSAYMTGACNAAIAIKEEIERLAYMNAGSNKGYQYMKGYIDALTDVDKFMSKLEV